MEDLPSRFHAVNGEDLAFCVSFLRNSRRRPRVCCSLLILHVSSPPRSFKSSRHPPMTTCWLGFSADVASAFPVLSLKPSGGCRPLGALAGPPRHCLLGLRLSVPPALRLQVSPGPPSPEPAQAPHLPGRGAGTCGELGGFPAGGDQCPRPHRCSLAGPGPLVHRAGSASEAVRLARAELEAARMRTGIRRSVARGQARWSWKG